MDETPNYFRYWGKARKQGEEGVPYHLLPYHCLDVAAMACAWWDASPAIRRAFATASGVEPNEACALEGLKAHVLFFVALHDYGKLDMRFQLKAKAALSSAWPDFDEDLIDIKGLEIKEYLHGPRGFDWFFLDVARAWSDGRWEAWMPWLAAVTGHHGVIPRDVGRAKPPQADKSIVEHDRNARLSWGLALEKLFLSPARLSLADSPPPCSPLLAGFCSVCDWLGSNADEFSYQCQPCAEHELSTYFDHARIAAEGLLLASGLVAGKKAYQGIGKLLPDEPNSQPRQVQTLVDRLPVDSGLTLIEAPTGSGKTEAALAYAWRLLDASLADSVVFALPTQATANAMLKRVEDIADLLFEYRPNLVLAHGKARFNDDFWHIKQNIRPVTAQGVEDARVQCSAWLAASRKRVFLGQIGVCTVDQVLVSVLPVRHSFVRGFGVGKSVLIVDEVHAYDRYMYGLLGEVLAQQRASGGSAILLSATLPSGQRQRLLSAWRVTAEAQPDAPYPLITHCGRSGDPVLYELPEAKRPPTREVLVEVQATPALLPNEILIERMLRAAEQGAQVVFICNLVDVAQQLAKLLAGKERVPVELFHARYRFADRQIKERRAVELFGKQGDRSQGRILVATQVVEQSLDLDFDWMLTQLCPVDLLFQRLGRLHRHQRPRPTGFENPCCTVLIPNDDDYGWHELIYGNARVLWRTARLLLQADGRIEFPCVYRPWIEQVYREDAWADEPEAMTRSYQAYWNDAQASYYSALRLVNEQPGEFSDTDGNVSILTRDGEMQFNVVPVQTSPEGLRLLDEARTLLNSLDEAERDEMLNLNTVAVPKSWRKFLPAPRDGLIYLPMQETWIAEQGKVTLTYSRQWGLERKES